MMDAVSPDPQQIEVDRALVRRLLDGEEAAFEELTAGRLDSLYRFALSRVGRDEALAEEMVQATLVSALEVLETWRGEATLLSFLCSICRFKIGGHFRAQRRRPAEVDLEAAGAEVGMEALPSGEPSPEETLHHKDQTGLVHRALDALPERYGRVLEWKYLDGLPVQEIAARLELAPKAAESVLTRARVAFRKTFESLGQSAQGKGFHGLFPATPQRSRG